MEEIKASEVAILAGGCFWGLEEYFRRLPGVLSTSVGYIGGKTENPTYKEVCSHTTGHAEALYIEFDPQTISYHTLLKHFFRVHDPSQLNRQGNDIGDNYRSAIYYQNEGQKNTALELIALLQKKLPKKIVTEVVTGYTYYKAEDYHQAYLQKNPGGYCHVNMNLLKLPLEDY